jgi:hypothetical protein
MRNLRDALMWRGTRAAALDEARKLKAAARRKGYDVVVRSTVRRVTPTYSFNGPPYGVFLEPHNSADSPDS